MEKLFDRLVAVKWLGNEGSHGEEVTRETIFAAFSSPEGILRDAYGDSHGVIAISVRRINRKKGSG